MSLVKGSSIFIIFITLMHPLTMIISMPMQQQQQKQVKDIKIASSSSSSSDEEDLISKTCNQTSYSDVCMATFLISNYTTSSSRHNATIYNLAFISINATAAYAANTSAVIAAILNGSTDFSDDQCLSDCLEQYGDAVDELHESMVALESCDYETVNVKVSAAMTNSDTCEGGFQDEGVSSPLTQRNDLFFKLCSNSLAILKLLV